MHIQQPDLPNMSMADIGNARSLTVRQVSELLRCDQDHVVNLIDEGSLGALNIARQGSGNRSKRSTYRIPVEAYRAYLAKCLTSSWDANPLRDLPLQALVNHHRELTRHLRKRGVSLRELQQY